VVKQRTQREPEHGEQRQLWISLTELDFLILLVESVDKRHRMLKYLRHLRRQFSDEALKLAEITARTNANAFYLEEKGTVTRMLKNVKASQRERANIASPTPQEALEACKKLMKKRGGTEC